MNRALRTLAALAAGLWCGAATAALPADEPLARIERDGMRMQVWLRAEQPGQPLRQGGRARLTVTLHSALDGTPLAGVTPGAWLDRLNGALPEAQACNRRIGGYVSRGLTERAWLDLTGYHVLLLNGDGGISVLDPQTNFAGKTSLRSVIALPAAGFDWDLQARQNNLYVSVPQTRQIAVADLGTLAAPTLLAVPGSPGRLRVHPSGRQVWVGVPQAAPPRSNTGVQPGEGGVFVVSSDAPHEGRWVATGNGHHELAFDPDGLAAVTNRDSGSISFVDPQSLIERRRVPIDGTPLSVVFEPRARVFIVADARSGKLLRFDHTGQPLGHALPLAPGIGPMALAPGGRWLLVLNSAANTVHVVDPASWQPAQDIAIAGRPFQLEFTSQYAYVRALDREDVSMIHLPSIGAGDARVQRFAAGERRPGETPDLPIALQIAALPDDSGVFALSPGDGAVYTYMQGMNAPMSSASPRGHPLRAVRVARQGLLEVERGVFEAMLTLPESADAMLALATDRPRARHCLRAALAPAPQAAEQAIATRLTWNVGTADAGAPQIEAVLEGDARRRWPGSLMLWVFQPGGGRQALIAPRASGEPVADAAGAGSARVVYRVQPPALRPGAWYVHAPATGDGIVTPAHARQYASFVVEARAAP